ncbi:MAG: Gfo/Idh/MocA family protein [Armatimonadota bacterium]
MMGDNDESGMSRRSFLKTAATTAVAGAGLMGLRAEAQDQPLTAGLIGCGGRGTGAAAQCVESAPNVTITALADLFPDKVGASRDNIQKKTDQEVPQERCFVGFDAYQKLIDTDVDIVLLATTPHFRPQQLRAAVAAGKHVFMEKPVCVDPWGYRECIAAYQEANEKKLNIVAGTQRRHQMPYLETYQRVADGAIGKILALRAYWCGGPLRYRRREENWSDMEYQIRNWNHFFWLSGDHIVEQHIHNLDVCNWFFGDHPVEAFGFGMRARKDVGNTYDFFCVEYRYADDTRMQSLCRQIRGCDTNVSEFIVGTQGSTNCAGRIWDLDGNETFRVEGKGPNPKVQEHADLINAIRTGEQLNEAKNVADSSFTAVIGRMSAYTGKRVKWDEAAQMDMRLGPTEYAMGDVEVEPVQLPGAPFPR